MGSSTGFDLFIILFIIFLSFFISGCFTAIIAESKGHSRLLWFFLGFAFPFISTITIGLCENAIVADEIAVAQGFEGKYSKRCQTCHGVVAAKAKLCKFCNSEILQNSEPKMV